MTTEPSAEFRRLVPILAIILIAYLMIVLDISIVITGLPKIRETLGMSDTGLSWVQNAYLLAYGGLLLLGARAGDLLGRRRMFIVGVAIFTAASLAVGTARSAPWLIGARAVQGLGAAILAPSTLALLQTSFRPGTQRTRAVAYYGSIGGIGATLGLVLGGIFTDWISWRVGFFMNVPIGIAMILAAPRYLPETERRTGQADVAGAVTSTFGMTALVYGIVRVASAGWSDVVTMMMLAASVVLLALFVRAESRASQPIMPLRLFASRERTGAYSARMLFLGAMVGFWFFMTQYLQRVLGLSPFATGLAFLPTTVTNFAAALAVTRLTQRLGNARLLAGGLALSCLGMFGLSQLSADAPYVIAVIPMILVGVGQGASLAPLTASGIAGVATEDAGAASGLVNVAHQLGGSLGLGVLVVVFAGAARAGALDARTMLSHQIATAFVAGTAMLVLALVLVIALFARKASERTGSERDAAVALASSHSQLGGQ
jgi:EmrB/QacA subfamily drug resistance transporter